MAETQKWSLPIEQSGTYTLPTAGKFVDRDIEVTVPAASETVCASRISGTVPVGVGAKANGKYPFTGSTSTLSGTATATVGTKGFTNATSYTGNSISGSVGVSGSMDEIILRAGGSGSASINSVTIGEKTSGAYPVTGSGKGSGSASASISKSGYGTAGVESASATFDTNATLNANINAAAATVTGSATVKPNSVTAANGNAKVSSTTTSTTVPSSGYYIGVTPATATSTSITQSKSDLTAGYLGSLDEISASGSVTGGSGSKYYVTLQSAGVTAGTTTVSGTTTKTATRGTFDVSEGYISGTAGDLPAATFKNSATSGKTYVDISDTPDAPILVSGDYLYIDKGYTDDLKISLAKLVPDPSDPTKIGASGDLLNGKILYDNDGNAVTGTIPTKTQSDLSASGKTVTVPAGYYATEVTKDIKDGSLTSLEINESAQSNVVLTAGTKSGSYYPLTASSLNGFVTTSDGYIGTGSTAISDSNGGVVGKIAASTTSGSDKTVTATATASAYDTTSTLASGTYTTSATTGYTYHIDSSASSSVDTQTATKTVGVGYVGSAVTATAKVNGASKSASAKTYLKDSTSSIASGGTIPQGTTLTIGKGYYPSDRTFTAQAFSSTENITGSLSTSIDSGYTAPALVDSKTSGKAYVTITGNGSMTAGNIYSGTANAETKYLEVYDGTVNQS